MNDIRLSFCIPTYNYAEFIGETLESIISQAGEEVEIIVGDGASTDNTEDVVKDYQQKFSKLHYYKFERKGGVDLDIARTVDQSKGDYCWLMSSDDVLKSGAIRRIIDEIKRGQEDVYLCNRTICDRSLKPWRYSRLWLSRRISNRVFDLSNKSDLLDYLNAAQSIGALFSYASSIIFRRSQWDEIGYGERYAGTNYAHVFRLLSLLQRKGSRLKYIQEQLVLFRGDNDSFKDKGYANRIRIDLDGYRLLCEQFFHDKEAQEAFKAVMRREHRYYFLPRLKIEVDNERQWSELKDKLSYYRYNAVEMFLINMLGASKTVVGMARSFKHFLRI